MEKSICDTCKNCLIRKISAMHVKLKVTKTCLIDNDYIYDSSADFNEQPNECNKYLDTTISK